MIKSINIVFYLENTILYNFNLNLNEFYMFLIFDNLKYYHNQIIYQYHLGQNCVFLLNLK